MKMCYTNFMNPFDPNQDFYGNYGNGPKASVPPAGGAHRSHGFETAALICGITGLFAASCGVGIFLGALAILFGALSKGGTTTTGPQGKAGIVLGIAAIIATTVTLLIGLVVLLTQYGGIDGLMSQYQQFSDAMNSNDPAALAEFYNQLYGSMGLTQ